MKEFFLIVGMTAVTFGVRYPVLALLGRTTMPPDLMRALRFVPVAVLSALSAPLIFTTDGQWDISAANPALVASLVAGIVAWKTRHLLKTIAVGMVVFVIIKLLPGVT